MRYSLLSFLTLSRKVQIFQPIPKRPIHNIGFIRDNVPINKYKELPNGIIVGRSDINRPDDPVIFIPESHYLFNLPTMDSYVDYDFIFGEDANLPKQSISIQFTELVKKEIGLKNYKELTRFLRK